MIFHDKIYVILCHHSSSNRWFRPFWTTGTIMEQGYLACLPPFLYGVTNITNLNITNLICIHDTHHTHDNLYLSRIHKCDKSCDLTTSGTAGIFMKFSSLANSQWRKLQQNSVTVRPGVCATGDALYLRNHYIWKFDTPAEGLICISIVQAGWGCS